MNRYRLISISLLLVLLAAGCSGGTAAPAPAASPTALLSAPVGSTAAAPATRAATAAAAASTGSGPVPAPPADNSRPLAKVPAAQRANRFNAPAATVLKQGVAYVATIVTSKGNIVAELFPDTPLSMSNFVTLAQNGFYDGLTFHRVEPKFVIQGGDPAGTGGGGPGYTIPAEIKHKHTRGALAWARTGDQVNPQRRSSGSQFYVTLAEQPGLDNQYTVFGQVTEGMDVAAKIAVGDTIVRVDITEGKSAGLPGAAASPAASPAAATPAPVVTRTAPPASSGNRPVAAMPVAQRHQLYTEPPAFKVDPAKKYQASIATSKGEIVADLDAVKAPVTVSNFVALANLGFYDNMEVTFSDPTQYVILGSPNKQPDSDVGYAMEIEESADTPVITGTLSAYPVFDPATGDARASGSLVFIAFSDMGASDVPLNSFGTVTSGIDIARSLTDTDLITKITISEK